MKKILSILLKMFLVLILVYQLLCVYSGFVELLIPKIESRGLKIYTSIKFYYVSLFLFIPFFLSLSYLFNFYKEFINKTLKVNKPVLFFKLIICSSIMFYSLSYSSCGGGCRYEGNYLLNTLGINDIFRKEKKDDNAQVFT
jgi:hypothetical protein